MSRAALCRSPRHPPVRVSNLTLHAIAGLGLLLSGTERIANHTRRVVPGSRASQQYLARMGHRGSEANA
jgi:hypothetical protein